MKNNIFNAEEPARKAVYLFTALAGFLYLGVLAQFMGSVNPRVQDNAEAKQSLNTQLTAGDRQAWMTEKLIKDRRRKEISDLVDQVEVSQPVESMKQASDLHGARAGTRIDLETFPPLFLSEPNNGTTSDSAFQMQPTSADIESAGIRRQQ